MRTPSQHKSIVAAAVGVWLIAAGSLGALYYLADVKPAVLNWSGVDPVTGQLSGGEVFDGWFVFGQVWPHTTAVAVASVIGVSMVSALIGIVVFGLVSARSLRGTVSSRLQDDNL